VARRGRFRIDPDTAQSSWSPMMQRSAPVDLEATLAAQVDQIVEALREVPPGGLRRRDLAKRVGAKRWGPGCLSVALRRAIASGRVREVGRRTYERVEPARDR
jgi:hypothetical protein